MRAFQRERKAKQEAEQVIEKKSSELYYANQKLESLNHELEKKVAERTKELAAAIKKVEESSLAKERFLANMSHEIRTPMNSVVGFTELLLQDEEDLAKKKYLNVIKASADNLLVIINDILDFSKITAGKIELNIVPFHFREFIEEIVESFQEQARKKDNVLQFTIENSVNGHLQTDRVRLKQILINLLSNAIKFTSEGLVKLSCSLVSNEGDLQNIQIKVFDTGIGIDDECIETIFDPFTQEDQSITKKHGGTGLGLAISKKLVELLDGEIGLESKKGHGTAFTVNIPMKKVGNPKEYRGTIEMLNEDKIPEGTRILVAEDNDFNQMLIQAMLGRHPIDLHIAENGKKAVEMIKGNNYDLVLMDIHMPEMDGLEATKIIRQELNSNIPIVALTANAMKEHRDKYILGGMDDYLSKPFHEHDLIKKITETINSKSKTKAMDLQLDYNLTDLQIVTKGDHSKYIMLLNKMIESIDRLLNKIETDIPNGEYKSIRLCIHTLKGSIAIINAQPIYSLILEAESEENSEEFINLNEQILKYGRKLSTKLKQEAELLLT